MTRKISFSTLCEEEKQKPTKLEDLYARAARVTRKAVTTVKMWAIGRQMPDDLTIEILAKEFQCDFDYLKESFAALVEQYKGRKEAKEAV